jgi:hypothetical protein
MGILSDLIAFRLSEAILVQHPVEHNFTSGARILFYPDGKMEISREKGVTIKHGVPVKAWLTEVRTFVKHAGYSQYDLSFDELTGTARVTPLNQNQGSLFA